MSHGRISRSGPAWRRRAAEALAIVGAMVLAPPGLPAAVAAGPGPYHYPVKGRGTVDGPEHAGVTVRNQVPASIRQKNIAGSDGSGLCVFASIQHTARYQQIAGLEDLLSWMATHEGGGWPEKVDAMLEQKLGPGHGVQYAHVFGEQAIPLLRKASAAGYLICVTLGYGERYGVSIDHMVNSPHWGEDWVCFFDNNFVSGEDNDPDAVYEWVPTEEAIERASWTTRGRGQLWAIIFFDNPQPPVPVR